MSALFSILGTLARFVGMVLLELILAIAIYTYLALSHLETFGWLVKLSKDILDMLIAWMEFLMPELANRAYATLLGELGPKAMLLLLTGLIAGALFRLIVWLISAAMNAEPGYEERFHFQDPVRSKVSKGR